jgi:glycosyltransferase involved in cell wall biosynthesis
MGGTHASPQGAGGFPAAQPGAMFMTVSVPPPPALPNFATLPPPVLSVVIPVLNEEENVPLIVARLNAVLEPLVATHELVFVDDGSTDTTLERLRALAAADPRVRALSFSRNFGKEIAIAAGLDEARGDAVVLIDADLQHPPEMIRAFVARWREGYDMVYGQRVDRRTDGALHRMLARRFYTLFERFGETPLPEGAGDFRLLSRRVVEALKRMPERARFSKGLYAWVGFRSVGVPFEVGERIHGRSKWNYAKLFGFAFDGLTSFSTLPLKVATYLGALISLFAMVYAAMIVGETLLFGRSVPGFPSLIVFLMFFAGIQLVFLGIIGEYVGRIFAEVKGRPLYVVAEKVGPEAAEGRPQPLVETARLG